MPLENKQTYLLLIVAFLICFTFGAGAIAYLQYRNLGDQQLRQKQAQSGGEAQKEPEAQQQPDEEPAQEPQEPRVVYSDGGYLPDPLIVKKGTTVTFENAADNPMWTASDQHPSHRMYPTRGGCLGSTFDACVGTPPGGTWSFTFDIVGSWNYHNHLNPANGGTIIVQE